MLLFFFFKQKTAYEMRISDWSSDVCSSDLLPKSVGFDEAAAVMLKGLTVQYLFRQTYRLQGDETILFHAAAGGVGLIACQWAKALGVKQIGRASWRERVCQYV